MRAGYWKIKKINHKWYLIERRWGGNQIEFKSSQWSDCIEYIDAVKHNNTKKMYDLRMEQARLCKGF